MENEQFTPEESALIERLGRAPQSSLSADAFEAIRARVLDSVPDIMPAPTAPASPPVALFVAGIVVIVAVVIVTLVFSQQMAQIPPPTNEPLAPTFTPVSSPTMTQTVLPTDVPTATPSSTLEPTATTAPTLTTAPSFTPSGTPSQQPLLVIEGPIQAIDGDQITIYDTVITIDPNNPLLDILEVGDIIRIEAGTVVETPTRDDPPAEVEIIDEDIAVNPGTGEVWRDDGSCANPPPPWAPANGWRRRCEGGASPGNSGNGNNGQGNNGQGNPGQGNPGQGNPGQGNNGQGNSGRGNNDDDD